MKDNFTIRFEDGNTEDIFMNRPFIWEFIWVKKITYIITNIIHVGDNIMVHVKKY